MPVRYYLKDTNALTSRYPAMLDQINAPATECEKCSSKENVVKRGFFHSPKTSGNVPISGEVVEMCQSCIDARARELRAKNFKTLLIGWPVIALLLVIDVALRTTPGEGGFFGFVAVLGGLWMLIQTADAFKTWGGWQKEAAWALAFELRKNKTTEQYLYWLFDDKARDQAYKMRSTGSLNKMYGR